MVSRVIGVIVIAVVSVIRGTVLPVVFSCEGERPDVNPAVSAGVRYSILCSVCKVGVCGGKFIL